MLPENFGQTSAEDEARRARLANLEASPVVLQVEDLSKTFWIPDHRVDTLKERVVHPFRDQTGRELRALRGVSFDVRRGEFFGIVGRNGSGKSTLLKILASIYRADGGRVRIAGRLAPFIELGVGFNTEFTARENVALNGVMMGLSRREAQGRLASVLDFAGLTEFADLPLKNYSSGMMVRLAFAVMVQADADIMLVDEVIAVGDASFAQKCMDVFRERRRSGKTVVLVTHDMGTVQHFCDRAMLIHDGDVRFLGDPEEAALEYFRLNFRTDDGGPSEGGTVPDINVKVRDCWLVDSEGQRNENAEQGVPIHFNLIVEARYDLREPVFNFHVVNDEGVWVFGFGRTLTIDTDGDQLIRQGRRIRISAELENPLLPGAYSVECWMSRQRDVGDMGLHVFRLLDFHVFGTKPGHGSVYARSEIETSIEPVAQG